MLSEVPLVEFIPLGISLFFALRELRKEEKESTRGKPRKRGFRRFVLPLLLIVSAGFAGWGSWENHKDAKAEKKRAEELADEVKGARGDAQAARDEATKAREETAHVRVELADARGQLNRMEGILGNPEAAERYVQMVRRLTFQLANEKTEAAAAKFAGSLDERLQMRDGLSQTNGKLLALQRPRFDPIYDFVVSKVTSWVTNAKALGYDVSLESTELLPIDVGYRNPNNNVRVASFLVSGDWFSLQIYPAMIEDGKVTQLMHMQIPYFPRKGTAGEIWAMNVTEDRYELANTRPDRFGYKPYSGNMPRPNEDAAFMDALNSSLDEVMQWVLVEVKAHEREARESAK